MRILYLGVSCHLLKYRVYANVFTIPLHLFCVYFGVSLPPKNGDRKFSTISVRRIVKDDQFTSDSIQPNWFDPHPPGPTLPTFQWGVASLLLGTSTSWSPSTSPRLARLRRRRIVHKVASFPQRQIISSITTYGRQMQPYLNWTTPTSIWWHHPLEQMTTRWRV